jgi:electron transfer flavoprotein beta subunit
MKILVCIKQVPDIDRITVEEDSDGRVILDNLTDFRMNRFDGFALEEALQIRERLAPEATVAIDVLTVGPERALEVLKRAMGMGAGHGIHLKSEEAMALSPAAVASGIARYAGEKGYALILTGGMSEDGMHGQVGPMVAAHLNRPCATHVVRMDLDDDGAGLVVEKEIEGGIRDRRWLSMPAVLTLQSGINRPRYPSLSNLLRANRQPVETIAVDVPETAAAGPSLKGLVLPRRSRGGNVLPGTLPEKAEALVSLLREKSFIQ